MYLVEDRNPGNNCGNLTWKQDGGIPSPRRCSAQVDKQ